MSRRTFKQRFHTEAAARELPTGARLLVQTRPAADEPDLGALAADERARVTSFRDPQRRHCFALGRETARTLLGTFLGRDPAEIALAVAQDGALEVLEEEVFLSIAHTVGRDLVVAAAVVHAGPVGVDLEAIKPRHPDLAKRFLGEGERELLTTIAGDHDRAIVTLWAVKEAVLKARRSGLRYSPKNLTVTITGPGQASVAAADGEAWHVAWHEAHGCVVAVATPS